jgi:hypothetical protein
LSARFEFQITILSHEKVSRNLSTVSTLVTEEKTDFFFHHNRIFPSRINKVGSNVCIFSVFKETVVKVTVNVKFTLQQATKAQRGSRGIAVLFL